MSDVALSRIVASLGGIGLLRPAPGTWASVAAVLLAWPILRLGGPWLLVAALLAAIAAGLWAIGREIARAGDFPGHHDPAWIVVDELAGQWIALLPVAFGAASNGVAYLALWPGWLAALLLFRLFDVWKPGPVRRLDRRPGALSVMGDDLAAGLMAALGVAVLAGLFHGVLLR